MNCINKLGLIMNVVTEPSICIPRTLNNITWRTVKDVFEQIIGKGTVDRVDLISDRNGGPFCKIFIHLRYWPNDGQGAAIRQRLLTGETVKIVYDNPWFWKCSASRLPKPTRDKPSTAPFVEFDTTFIEFETHTSKKEEPTLHSIQDEDTEGQEETSEA